MKYWCVEGVNNFKQSLSEPEFYGDVVYKFKKIGGMTVFLISLENL